MKIQSVIVARLFLSQKFTGVKPNPRSSTQRRRRMMPLLTFHSKSFVRGDPLNPINPHSRVGGGKEEWRERARESSDVRPKVMSLPSKAQTFHDFSPKIMNHEIWRSRMKGHQSITFTTCHFGHG
jgi:hypothetical protein